MEAQDINSIPADAAGGYDRRRMAPNGGYTNAGESAAARGMSMEGSSHAHRAPATASLSSFGSGGHHQQLAFGGAPVTPATPEVPSATASNDAPMISGSAPSPFDMRAASASVSNNSTLNTMTSFGSTASTGTAASSSGRKRKCSGDGVDTCGSCGHRLMTQRVVVSGGTSPELDGYCPTCVCRCALCGRAVLWSAASSTVLDETLLMTARQLGIPIEDGIAMGQDIGIMALVCEAGCMSRLNRMRRMAKRKSGGLPVAGISGSGSAAFDNAAGAAGSGTTPISAGGDGEGNDGMDLG